MQIANRIVPVPLLLLCPFSVLAGQVSATAPVSVFVADRASTEPLVNARVEFPSLSLSRQTDPLGVAFFASVKSGVLRLTVSKIGYVPVDVEVGLEFRSANAIELTVAMTRVDVAHVLDTVEVKGRTGYFGSLSGFEGRRSLGLGKFFTAAQLDSSANVPLADLLARRVTGVRTEWGYGRRVVHLVSLRGPISISQPECFVQVYVDNNKANDEDLAQLQSGDLQGVEYYPIAPPPRYVANSACGVLLVWTKR